MALPPADLSVEELDPTELDRFRNLAGAGSDTVLTDPSEGDLLSASPQARNPLIAEASKRAGLVKRTGQGVNRIYRNQLALGRPLPDYSRSTGAWVQTRLSAGPADRELAKFTATSERDGRPLDLRTLQVLHKVRAEGRIASAQAGRLFQVNGDETRSALNAPVERGLLEPRGEGKGAHLPHGAAAYGGRSMLDLIADDKHQWLLQSVRESSDLARVA